jgi:uncharacterized peroxidase-related enzyme
MARVRYVEKEEATESLRPTYERIEKSVGIVLRFLKVLAHSPELFQGFLALDGALRRTDLDPKLRELAYMRASELNGCDYCRHYHHAAGRKAGLSERQVHDLEESGTSDAYDDRQRAVIRFAEQLTRGARAEETLMAELKSFLSDRELVELTATVALANFTNRINNALEVELP